ncbi:hypothetical protein, partial [Salmonella enterica]|uniref:hypothetical protein n=1 Tax=Salmonella enterica TaxID=28901 RepID=UPI00112F24EE
MADLTAKLAVATEQNNALQKTTQALQRQQTPVTGLKQDITRLTAELTAATKQNDVLTKQVNALRQAAGSAVQEKVTADLASVRKQVADLTAK